MSIANKTGGPGLEYLEWIFWRPEAAAERGVDVLPLRSAPRDDPAPHVIDAGLRACAHNVFSIDERGTDEFREAVGRQLQRDFNITADIETEILATNGALNATFIALAGLLENGDEVIIPTPHYYYRNSVEILRAVPVFVPCYEHDWSWDIDAIEAAITPRTKVFLFVNPCNPTGFMPTLDQLRELGEVAERHNLVIIEDLAYERFTHEGRPTTSVGSVPGLWERTLLSYSFHKNYSLHAWRAGYLAGPEALMERFTTMACWINLRVNHVSQAVATAALNGPMEWLEEIIDRYRAGRDMLHEQLSDDAGITMNPSVSGGTMGYLNVNGLGLPSKDVSIRLLEEYGIATVPGWCFGEGKDGGQHVRIPFGFTETTDRSYQEVIDRLKEASAVIRAEPRAAVPAAR